MPTIPQQQTIVQYLANASQLIYTFAFYAPLPTDIQVFLQSPTAIPVPAADILVLNVDYTVTYNADPTTGGFITLTVAPTTGWYLTINRMVAASLTTDFSNVQNINGADLDTAFDRLLLLCQQNLNYNLQRNLSYIINSYLPSAAPYTQLPVLPQNYIWVGSGSGVVAAQLAVSPSASVLQSMLANNSPGTDGARLVGYYNALTSTPTTVQAYLSTLFNQPTINQPNIIGITDGSVAAAGSVGEIMSAQIVQSSSVSLTTATPVSLISLTLTPGQWIVYSNAFFTVGGSCTVVAAGVNTVTNTLPDVSKVASQASAGVNSGGVSLVATPINVTVTTPVYMVVEAVFTTSTVTACGYMWAVRAPR